MTLNAEYLSPDGILRFIVWRDDNDVSLGFAGYSWHTHADLLVGAYGASEQIAVARFVEDLLSDRAIIAVSRAEGVTRDVWIADDPILELRYKPEEEDIVFRYWSGRRWQAG